MSLFSGIFKYVWPQLRKRKGVLNLVLIGYIIRNLIDHVVVPIYFKRIIDLFSTGNRAIPSLSHDLYLLLFTMIGINVAVFFVARILKFTLYRLEINVIRDLRDFSFQKIEQNSQTFFNNTFAGSLVTKARRFVGGFETAFDTFISNFLKFFVVLTGTFVVLFFHSKLISLIFGIWVVINLSITFFLLKKKIKYDLEEAEQDSKISGRLADVFSNISAVKFFSARNREIASFGEYTKEGERRSIKAWFMGAKMDMIQHLLIIIVEFIILYIMIGLWLRNEISTGTVVLIQTYMVVVLGLLWEFGNSMTRFMKGISDMKETVDIFETKPDLSDPEFPEIPKMKEGKIEFKNVSFRYAMGDVILNDFNLSIAPGERVGIVGHSGAGKTTITKILLRLNDVTSGAITIDGQDIRNVTQNNLREVISFVPQEPVLFHRPIKENISYGKFDATEEEIIEVSKKAHTHEFISKLPHGYDTLVGERGVKLSGGERQRVAIARAMLKNSPILVLDEATSSLDSISESYIQDAFNELMKGKTTIVIAHRLSTIQKMDRIIVLDAGKIVEEGTHAELLAKNGMYKELWDHQTGGFLE